MYVRVYVCFLTLPSDRAAERRVEVGSDLPDLPIRTEAASENVYVYI